jgi:hypothetical protein
MDLIKFHFEKNRFNKMLSLLYLMLISLSNAFSVSEENDYCLSNLGNELILGPFTFDISKPVDRNFGNFLIDFTATIVDESNLYDIGYTFLDNYGYNRIIFAIGEPYGQQTSIAPYLRVDFDYGIIRKDNYKMIIQEIRNYLATMFICTGKSFASVIINKPFAMVYTTSSAMQTTFNLTVRNDSDHELYCGDSKRCLMLIYNKVIPQSQVAPMANCMNNIYFHNTWDDCPKYLDPYKSIYDHCNACFPGFDSYVNDLIHM